MDCLDGLRTVRSWFFVLWPTWIHLPLSSNLGLEGWSIIIFKLIYYYSELCLAPAHYSFSSSLICVCVTQRATYYLSGVARLSQQHLDLPPLDVLGQLGNKRFIILPLKITISPSQGDSLTNVKMKGNLAQMGVKWLDRWWNSNLKLPASSQLLWIGHEHSQAAACYFVVLWQDFSCHCQPTWFWEALTLRQVHHVGRIWLSTEETVPGSKGSWLQGAWASYYKIWSSLSHLLFVYCFTSCGTHTLSTSHSCSHHTHMLEYKLCKGRDT